ncbi:hypothetical protein NC651_017496 [Populus alba x Populus x berolinensis]|nr:hypothetical protein NC651_017496 [Populus alba x Populus x berolinensis]
MASLPFSCSSVLGLKIHPNPTTMAPFVTSIKSPLGPSKSAFLQRGFSLRSPNLPRFASKARSFGVFARAATEKSVHDFTVKDIDGKDVALSKFKGKALLIVNVASKCGLTSSNYSELTHIYEKYKLKLMSNLMFCHAPEALLTLYLCGVLQLVDIENLQDHSRLLSLLRLYKAEFPIFDKVDVNGPSTAPVYQFLKSSAGGFLGDLIKWNFEKFLVDKNGKVVERYQPTTSPFQIEEVATSALINHAICIPILSSHFKYQPAFLNFFFSFPVTEGHSEAPRRMNDCWQQ